MYLGRKSGISHRGQDDPRACAKTRNLQFDSCDALCILSRLRSNLHAQPF